MDLTAPQKTVLNHLGIDIYQDKSATEPPAEPSIKYFQCQLKNNTPFLIVADWNDDLHNEQQTLCDKMIAAIGNKQSELNLLEEADSSSQSILALGSNAKRLITKLNPEAKILATISLEQIINDPSLKRQAWTVMQQL